MRRDRVCRVAEKESKCFRTSTVEAMQRFGHAQFRPSVVTLAFANASYSRAGAIGFKMPSSRPPSDSRRFGPRQRVAAAGILRWWRSRFSRTFICAPRSKKLQIALRAAQRRAQSRRTDRAQHRAAHRLAGTVGHHAGFPRHGAHRFGGPSVVAAGVAEALFTTAAGLLVAVPAGFNHFTRRITVMLTIAENQARQIRLAAESAPQGNAIRTRRSRRGPTSGAARCSPVTSVVVRP